MELGQVAQKTILIPFTNISLTINSQTMLMMFITMSIIIIISYMARKNLQKKILNKQLLITELFISAFDKIIIDTISNDARKYFPLITTIFIYVLTSNLLGMIPLCKSPTEDLSVCIAMAGMVFVTAHGSCIRKKGLKKYIKLYLDPYWFLFPLNVLGEVGKTLSHCFRLFGNIFGGAIIFSLVSYVTFKIAGSFGACDISEMTSFALFNKQSWLSYFICSPFIILFFTVAYAFFGLFAGVIQALVFTMLALTYIGVVLEE